jgi:hypothetical protein
LKTTRTGGARIFLLVWKVIARRAIRSTGHSMLANPDAGSVNRDFDPSVQTLEFAPRLDPIVQPDVGAIAA